MFRVAGEALKLPKELLPETPVNASMQMLMDHKERLVYITASAIQNNEKEPDQKLIEFISKNFGSSDLEQAVHASLSGLELEAFSNSIVLAGATQSILNPETSPADGSGLIASHTG
ncbi:MAG: hypothetical protein EOO85_17065 [Pedobacter sp.]|nr:MAG: hypothetical protein EOO85_17065 [Pedobacter sp.]